MTIQKYPFLRKVFWLLLAVFLLAVQPAVAAELTEDELQTLPTVSIIYYTAADGEAQTLDAVPTLSTLGKSYWAMLPAEAFSFPMTMTIIPSATAWYSFDPPSGTELTYDINTVDFEGMFTMINAYQDEQMVDTYYLYLSAAKMPVDVAPAEVPVYYVDSQDNTNVLHYEVISAYYNQENIVTVDTTLVPANYTLISEPTASVTVNDQGMAAPEWVTFYFEKQILQGTLNIYYTDRDGHAVASSQTQTLDPGTYYISPTPTDLEAGYTLSADNPAETEVKVSELGEVLPAAITFFYDAAITTATVTVNYTDENNIPLANPEVLEYTTGEHTVTPNSTLIPDGYTLVDPSTASVPIKVDSIGGVIPKIVTFIYKKDEVAEISGDVKVYYTDTKNNQIMQPETLSLSLGQHVVVPSEFVPSGYTLSATSPSEHTVTVYADGSVSPMSVTFVYEEVSQTPITGTLTIRYEATDHTLLTSKTASLPAGVSVVSIEESSIPAGYALAANTPSEFSVTVDNQGIADPSTITFTLTVIPTNNYTLTPVDSDAVTSKSDVNFRSSPETTDTSNIAFAAMPQGTQVWVYGTFVTNDREWASIRYNDTDCYVWYSLISLVSQEPVTGTLTVQYRSTDSTFSFDQTRTLEVGSHTITPDASLIPAGYNLAETSDAQYNITVDAGGALSLDTVTFTYAPQTLDPTTYADYTTVSANANTNDTGVRFRSEPSTATNDNILYQVEQGTEVWVYGTFTKDDKVWAYIHYADADCYVWNSLLTLAAPEPAESLLTVQYHLADGTAIASDQTVPMNPGNYAVSPDPSHIPDGYVLADSGQSPIPVTVNDSGVVSPDTIEFIYTTAAAAPTDPTDPTAYADYTTLGINAVTNAAAGFRSAPDAAVSDNIIFANIAQGTQVWVYGTFTNNGDLWAYINYNDTSCYVPRSLLDPVQENTPVSAVLTVLYQLTDGTEIADSQQLTLDEGTHPITPDTVRVPAGYTPAEDKPTQFSVTVDGSGTVTPNPVTFYYTLKASETPEDQHTDISGNYDDYTLIGIDAVTNDTGVRLRSTPTSASIYNILYQVPQSTPVWVYGSFTKDGTLWAYVSYNNTDCYVWYSLLDIDESAIPVRGTVTVQYHLADNTEVIPDQSVILEVGEHTVAPDTALVPAGYTLTGSAQASVTVAENGDVSPNPVTFYYDKDPATGTLTVQYHLADGSQAAADQTQSLTEGTHTITPDAAWVSSEYVLSTAAATSADVTVGSDGKVFPNPVIFYYFLDTSSTPPADISGTYADYTAIGVSAVTNKSAVNLRSTPKSTVTTNIVSTIPLGTTVWVHGTFTTGDRMWAYVRYADVDCYVWYSLLTLGEKDEPVSGSLTVQYHLADGSQVADDQTLTLAEGLHTISPDAARIPAGYTLTTPAQTNVTVDANGGLSLNPVTFFYEKEPVTASLTVQYRLTDSSPLIGDQTLTLAPGTHSVTPDSSLIPAGYKLSASSASQVSVTVSDTGTASVNPVTFFFEKEVVSGTVTIRYVVNGADVITPQAQTRTAGNYTIYADESLIPAGYAMAASAATAYSITVDNAGNVSPNPVVFQLESTEKEMYVGYAVTTEQVSLRNDANYNDSTILTTLPANTLLYLNGQVEVGGATWTGAQTRLGASYIGMLPYNSVRTITQSEAQTYIDSYNASHEEQPTQQSGYYLTLGDDVPLRSVPGAQASVSAWIAEDQVIYVTEQVSYDGYTWDVSYYGTLSGYIRDDQVRPMSAAEVATYLANASPTATPAQTAAPYNENAESSYGYVTANSVNFRQSAGGTRIGVLNQYALGLVVGSTYVNNTQWYNINQSGTTGWVSGDYFHVMSLTEFQAFLTSNEYKQGLSNSGSTSSSSTSSSSPVGSATQGNVSAVEDWNVDVWKNPNSSLNVSYEPFNPYATPTIALEEATPTPAPTSTFVIGTMIPITYDEETKETQSGTSWVGLVLGGLVLAGGAGGVYAYALTQNKKRKAAARAAAARQRSQQQSTAQNPYARRAAAAPPTAAGQQKTQNPYQRPNPYARPQQQSTAQNPYAQQPPQNTARTANPYAQRPAPPQPEQPQQPAQNPYARPTQPEQPTETTKPSGEERTYTGRRSDRYRNHDDDNT